jgi:protoheme IX farnesyltransferase
MFMPQVLTFSVWHRLRAYGILTKPRLSVVVVFSAVMGAVIGGGGEWWLWPLLLVGGYGVTGAANALNQVIERETDRLMVRTASRPLPLGQVSVAEAVGVAIGCMGIGLVALAAIRWEVALVGLLALLIYVFVYTPLKRVGPIAVVVGAIPGALPPVIGYWASQPVFDHQLWVLFGVQFLWQFPHFWIIAWISREDYGRAGFRLLPFLDEKSNRLAILAVSFLLSLSGLVVGLYSGLGAGLWTTLLGLGVLGMAIRFYRRPELFVARQFLIGLTIFLTLFYLGLWLWSQR